MHLDKTDDRNNLHDLFHCLNERGLELIIHQVFEHLSLEDLECCQFVNKEWHAIVQRLWEHHEINRVGKSWAEGNPTTRTIQCEKQRSVCTISAISIDESAIVVGLGSSGLIELWDRRNLEGWSKVSIFHYQFAYYLYN